MQRRHKKREGKGKVERDTARVFYRRLSPVRLKIQFKIFFPAARMGVGSNLQNRASYWADMPTPLGAWVLVNAKALGPQEGS